MQRFVKVLFFALIVKPVVFVILGLNIRHREKLPTKGPAVIAANHNSHLDTLVIMSLYSLSHIHRIRPVAASDYFMKSRFIAWFATSCIGIIPFDRSGSAGQRELFNPLHDALDKGDILILFPEGSRGKPEELGRLKKGLYYLLKERIDTPVAPIHLEGLGNALPRGEALLVPFTCSITIGDPIITLDSSRQLNSELEVFFRTHQDEE